VKSMNKAKPTPLESGEERNSVGACSRDLSRSRPHEHSG
jgi:hypothetical protein